MTVWWLSRVLTLVAVLFVRSVTSAYGETIIGQRTTQPPPAAYSALERARNETMLKWLPRGEDLFEPWRRHLTAQAPLGWNDMLSVPNNATSFGFGDAGPGGELVYDPARGIVLNRRGCCAWWETVLMVAPKPPPQPAQTADLSAIRAGHAIALGASTADVVRAYGPARLHASTTTAGLRVLSYYRNRHVPGSGCGWFENFVFRANRLIEIQAGNGC